MTDRDGAEVHKTEVMQKLGSLQEVFSPQHQSGFATNGLHECSSVVCSFDGVHAESLRQLQGNETCATSTVSRADCTAATGSRVHGGTTCDSGSSTGCVGREPSLHAPAPFPAVAPSEAIAAHRPNELDRVQLRSNSGSTLTAPPDPFSLRQDRFDNHRAAAGRQHATVSTSAMPGQIVPGTVAQHLQVAEHQADVERSGGASCKRVEQAEGALQNTAQEGTFRGEDRRHLKGELEGVRAMIAEMQALRTAVQHGDLDLAMVPPRCLLHHTLYMLVVL